MDLTSATHAIRASSREIWSQVRIATSSFGSLRPVGVSDRSYGLRTSRQVLPRGPASQPLTAHYAGCPLSRQSQLRASGLATVSRPPTRSSATVAWPWRSELVARAPHGSPRRGGRTYLSAARDLLSCRAESCFSNTDVASLPRSGLPPKKVQPVEFSVSTGPRRVLRTNAVRRLRASPPASSTARAPFV